MKNNLKVNQKFFELLEHEEGYRENVYLDTGGAPTIGIGHLLTKSERTSGKIVIAGESVRYDRGLNRLQVWALAEQDVSKATETVLSSVNVPLSQNQFNALVSLTFNIGNTAFVNSTLLKVLNKGQYQDVPDQFRRWKMDNGKENHVLKERREREIVLWRS